MTGGRIGQYDLYSYEKDWYQFDNWSNMRIHLTTCIMSLLWTETLIIQKFCFIITISLDDFIAWHLASHISHCSWHCHRGIQNVISLHFIIIKFQDLKTSNKNSFDHWYYYTPWWLLILKFSAKPNHGKLPWSLTFWFQSDLFYNSLVQWIINEVNSTFSSKDTRWNQLLYRTSSSVRLDFPQTMLQ